AVTLISSFRSGPQSQQPLMARWMQATEESLGRLPGIISTVPHPGKGGMRVVNYEPWKIAENWENLVRIGSQSGFREMAKYARTDAHLYEVCYLFDQTGQQSRQSECQAS